MAVAAAGISTLLGSWLRPFAYATPFLFFSPAVIVSAWVGGVGPGLLATLLTSLSANYFFLAPYGALSLDGPSLARTAVFAVTVAGISCLVELARRQLLTSGRELEHTSKKVTEIEQRYRSLFEHLLGGFTNCQMIFDEAGHPLDFVFLEVNAAFERLTGLQDVIGKRAREVITAIDQVRPDLLEIYGRVALTGRPERFEIEFRRLGKWFDASAYSTRRGYCVTVFDDITERKRAEQRLKDHEEELTAIYENAPLVMLLVDAERHVHKANRFVEQLVGQPSSELLGLGAGEALHCLDALNNPRGCGLGTKCEHCTLRGVIEDTFATGHSHHQVEVVLPFTDGDRTRELTFLLSTARLKLRGQSQVLVTLQDITDRKHAEQALIRSEKLAATGRLAATIAHEINNPLEAMTNLAYLLGRSITDPDLREYVTVMEKQLQTVSRITNQTLKFHRENGQPAAFQLSTLVHELLEFYLPKAKEHGVKLVDRLEAEGAEVIGFSGEIRQVISNLLLNAIEATPKNGQVTVHLYKTVDWGNSGRHGYRVSIADTGTGIDSQHRSRIFEPFFTTKGENGTGLGLWVSMGIISRAGGSLRVWSTQRPGHSGTCFSVFLPAEAHPKNTGRRRYDSAQLPGHMA